MVESVRKKCPICGKEINADYAPFCSKRCADIDLNRWLNASYVVHTDEKPEESPIPAEQQNDF